MEKKYLILLAVSGAIVAIDQAVKMYIHTEFRLGESVAVLQNIFNLTYVRNPGAAFGFLREAPEAFRSIFFLSVPPTVMLIILAMLHTTPESNKLQTFALSSVFGGAIGNYIDRVRFGYVVDFLDFHYHNLYTYPAFNIADIAIVCGVGFILFEIVKEWFDSRKKITA
ncbi:MAG: signal peptidase II [Bdellovibrionales bacterium]|nr:signal peptidase II [Bdellovibrionales bacterium]